MLANFHIRLSDHVARGPYRVAQDLGLWRAVASVSWMLWGHFWFLAIAFFGVSQVWFPDHLYQIVWAHLNLNGMKPQNLHFLTSSWAIPRVQNLSPKVRESREGLGKSVRSGVSVKGTHPSLRDPPPHWSFHNLLHTMLEKSCPKFKP